jgi:excisionase family DNA binding protein
MRREVSVLLNLKIEGLEAHIKQVVEEAVDAALSTRADDPWLTSDEAAAYLKIARSTLHDLVSEGRLPRVGGRKTRLMFRRSDLDAYIASRGQRMNAPSPERGVAEVQPLQDDTGTHKRPGKRVNASGAGHEE